MRPEGEMLPQDQIALLILPFKVQRREDGMDFYLSCETCLRLWAEYGTASIGIRAGAVRTEWEAASSKRRVQDAFRRCGSTKPKPTKKQAERIRFVTLPEYSSCAAAPNTPPDRAWNAIPLNECREFADALRLGVAA
jgi:hypothetical protein